MGSVLSPLAIAATVDAALEEDAEATAAVTSASDDGDDVDADAVATVTSGSEEEDDVDGPLEDAEAVATTTWTRRRHERNLAAGACCLRSRSL